MNLPELIILGFIPLILFRKIYRIISNYKKKINPSTPKAINI